MNYAQWGEDQNWRIKFGTVVITDILCCLKGHTNKLKYFKVFIFTIQHAHTLKEFRITTTVLTYLFVAFSIFHIWATAFKMAASESKKKRSITPNDINNVVPIIFPSQKLSKLCHDRFNIYLKRLFYICTWKITKLKLTTSRAQSDSRDSSIGTIMWFCCKHIKSELIRCVGSFTSCDLDRLKQLATTKYS